MSDNIQDSINLVTTSFNDLNTVLEQLKVGEFQFENYVTKDQLAQYNFAKESELSQYATNSALSRYATNAELSSQYVNKNDASSQYVSKGDMSQYVTQSEINNFQIPLDPDSNNLLRKTANGYVVELQAAPNVSVQYVSSSKGSDTTGDGSSGNPFRTIYKALSRIPDNTAVTIFLWYQDTFNFWDGHTPAYTGNEKWSDLLGFSWNVGRRSVAFNSWGAPSLNNLPAGVTDDSVMAEGQPVIVFRYSTPPDTGQSQCPGFWLDNGNLSFSQISLKVLPDNLPNSSQIAWWSAPFVVQHGNVTLYGCTVYLANGVLCGADGANGASGTFTANYYTWFDTTNGKAFVDATCGYTVNLNFTDRAPGGSITVGGNDTGLKYRGTNPSKIENPDGFVRLGQAELFTVHQGVKTQNSISQ